MKLIAYWDSRFISFDLFGRTVVFQNLPSFIVHQDGHLFNEVQVGRNPSF